VNEFAIGAGPVTGLIDFFSSPENADIALTIVHALVHLERISEARFNGYRGALGALDSKETIAGMRGLKLLRGRAAFTMEATAARSAGRRSSTSHRYLPSPLS